MFPLVGLKRESITTAISFIFPGSFSKWKIPEALDSLSCLQGAFSECACSLPVWVYGPQADASIHMSLRLLDLSLFLGMIGPTSKATWNLIERKQTMGTPKHETLHWGLDMAGLARHTFGIWLFGYPVRANGSSIREYDF